MRQVTAAVIIEDGLLFLVRRAEGQSLAGFWELPGGKIEPGESAQECLVRELQEELEMRAIVGEELARTEYHYDHGSFEMIALRTDRLSEFSLSVHDEFKWVSKGDIEGVKLAPADVKLVGQLVAAGHWS